MLDLARNRLDDAAAAAVVGLFTTLPGLKTVTGTPWHVGVRDGVVGTLERAVVLWEDADIALLAADLLRGQGPHRRRSKLGSRLLFLERPFSVLASLVALLPAVSEAQAQPFRSLFDHRDVCRG